MLYNQIIKLNKSLKNTGGYTHMFMTRNTKVKLFTHNDLDGIGCEILGRLAFEDIDVTIVKNPKDASEKVTEFMDKDEYTNYDKVFITDISVDEDTADYIDGSHERASKFVLLDHHGTAEFLNEYSWASVRTHGDMGREAGTNMFFDYLAMNGLFKQQRYIDALTIFVEKIRRYDCWEWKELYSDFEARDLNNLLYLIGHKEFVKQYIYRLRTLPFLTIGGGSWHEMFDKADNVIIKMDNDKKEAYIDRKEKQMKTFKYSKGRFGLVFSEQYTSELGNDLSSRHPELDFVALVDMGSNKVSLRTIHGNIDLGKDVAKLFGGGGHPKASGFEFSDDISAIATGLIFNSKGSINANKHVANVINQKGLLGKLTKIIDMFGKK